MADVALADAQVIWEPGNKMLPTIKVVGRNQSDELTYGSAWGACNREFAEADNAGQLQQLFGKFVEWTVLHKLPAMVVHDALIVIPEYRAVLPIGLDPTRGR